MVGRFVAQIFVRLTLAAGFVSGETTPTIGKLQKGGIDDVSRPPILPRVHRRKVPAECGPAVATVHFEAPVAPSGLPAHLRGTLAYEACPTVLAVATSSSAAAAVDCCFAAVPEASETGFAIQLHSNSGGSNTAIIQIGGPAPLTAPIDPASICSSFGAIAAALDDDRIVASVLGVDFTGTKAEIIPDTAYAAAFAAASCLSLRGRVASGSGKSTMTASVTRQEGGVPSSSAFFTAENGAVGVRPPWLAVHAETGQAGVESSPTPVFGIPNVFEGTMLVPTRASGLLAVAESAATDALYVGATYFPSRTASVGPAAVEPAADDVRVFSALRSAAADDTIIALNAQSIVPTLLNTAVLSGTSVTSPIVIVGITASGDAVKLPASAVLMCTSFAPDVVQTDADCNLVLQSTAERGAEEASINVIYNVPTGKSVHTVLSVRILYPHLIRLTTETPMLRPIGRPVAATSAEFTSSSAEEGSAYYDDDDDSTVKANECAATSIFERTPVKAVAYFQSTGDANDDYDGTAADQVADQADDVVEIDVTRLVLPSLTSSNPGTARVVDGWVVGNSVGRTLIMRTGVANDGVEWRSCSISVAASPAIEVAGLEIRLINDADLRVSSSGFSVSAGISRYFYTITVSQATLSFSRRAAEVIVNAVLSDGSRMALTSDMGLTVVSDDTLAVDVVPTGRTFVASLPTVGLTNPAVRIRAAWKVPGCDKGSAIPTHHVTLLMEAAKASLDGGFVQLPELRLTSTRQKLASGTTKGDAETLATPTSDTARLPVFSALSLKLALNGDVSDELAENPSIEMSANVIIGEPALVTVVDNMIIANTAGRAGTVVVSAWVRGRIDIGVAQVTIEVLASNDSRWVTESLTHPAASVTVESQGPAADKAAYAEWIAANGNAVAFEEEAKSEGNVKSVRWTHREELKELAHPGMPSCTSWSQPVHFAATYDSPRTGDAKVAKTSAVYTIADTKPPVFSAPPVSKVVTVARGDKQAVLLEWQAEHGEGVAVDAGSSEEVRWSWETAQVEVEDPVLWEAGCSETFRTTFTVADSCGNTATAIADVTIITSPLQLRTLGVPAELPFRDSGSSVLNEMKNWVGAYSAALVVDSSGPVQWSESSLAPQSGVVYSTLLSNSVSTVTANEAVCSSSSFQGKHEATDSCGGRAVLAMDWILVERTPIDSSKTIPSTGMAPPIFETEPTNDVTESGGPDSLDSFKEWLANKAGAVLGPGYENLVWKSPELHWAATADALAASGCAPSQVCTATFSAINRCGILFGYTATYTIAPDCISAKMRDAGFRIPGTTTLFPSWDNVAIATEPESDYLGGRSTPTSAAGMSALSSETWGIIAVSLGIIFIAFGIALWCKRRPAGTFNNQPYYPDAKRGRGGIPTERMARAMQRAYANRYNPTQQGISDGGRRRVQFAPQVYIDGEQHPAMRQHPQDFDYGLDLDGHSGSILDESELPDSAGRYMSGVVTTRAQLEANDLQAEKRMAAMMGDMQALQNRIGLLKDRASSSGFEWDNEHEVVDADPFGSIAGNEFSIHLSSGQAYPPGNHRETVASPSSGKVDDVATYDVAGMSGPAEPDESVANYDVAGASHESGTRLVVL